MNNTKFMKYQQDHDFKVKYLPQAEKYAVWRVTDAGGEDGRNIRVLGYYEGKLIDVVKFAVNLPGFMGWGTSGGDFYEVPITKIDENSAEQYEALKEEKKNLEARLKALKIQLGE